MNELPPLIYGTAWKKERTAELVEKAILSGFRGIDTACQPKHYNEPGVGEALQRLKSKGISRVNNFSFKPNSLRFPDKIQQAFLMTSQLLFLIRFANLLIFL